jgi:hypothetical protein
VIGRRQEEPGAGRDRAEASDDEPLGTRGVENVAGLERPRVVGSL